MGLSWVSDDLSDPPPARPRGDHRARRPGSRRLRLVGVGLTLACAVIRAGMRPGAYPPARPSARSAFRRYWV